MRLNKALEQAKTYEEIKNIIDKPNDEIDAYINFFGARVFKIQGYSGYSSIDGLANKIDELVEKNRHFNEVERGLGKIISAKIDYMYLEIDKKEGKMNCITKFFYKVFWPCFEWEVDRKYSWQSRKSKFEVYTKNQRTLERLSKEGEHEGPITNSTKN